MEQDELRKEKEHLAETIAVIDQRLEEAAAESGQYAETLRALQEERLEQSRMDIGGLYSPQGFSDLLELSQETQALKRVQDARESGERAMRTLVRMRDKPYFARIDFRPADSGEVRRVYIGRATLMRDDPMEIFIHDWRVPIASVFYQYGVGPAAYEAPAGRIEGELERKRQYEIRKGELCYYFDANEQVLDGFLRDLLARPASQSMQTIVETIQRDQDRIIRDMDTDLLMVQGAAGSGKTSVALHRVAWLMYQGQQKRRLSPNDALILAPNATFERYIARVLPDLGEAQVRTMLLEELLAEMLPGVSIEPRCQWVEAMQAEPDVLRRSDARHDRGMKGGKAFLRMLDRLVDELPRRWIPFSDVEYDGHRVASAALLRVAACNPVKIAPLGVRLRMLEQSIWQEIHALRPARHAKLLLFAERFPQHAMEASVFARMLSIRESGQLLAQIRRFTRVNAEKLYRALFENRDALARLAEGIMAEGLVEPMRLATRRRLSEGPLPYEDAAAIAYLEARINGHRAYTHLEQVVIDEAQDLDAVHVALIAQLFPGARFTMLGDVHQTLTGAVDMSLYEDMRTMLGRKSSLLAVLNKSFRCTREIFAFSARFLPKQAVWECFGRSGEEPGIHAAETEREMDALLLRHARECLQSGHRSVALLCKTEKDASLLFERLGGEQDIVRVGPDDALQRDRVSILSLYTAKGLEFDAVLMCFVDAVRYCDAEDERLLYIGCTRALHVLRLFYTGERSPLLPGEEGTKA